MSNPARSAISVAATNWCRHGVHVGSVHLPRNRAGCGPRDGRGRHHRPVAVGQRPCRSPPSRAACCPCDRSGRPGSRSWLSVSACTNCGEPPPRRFVLGRVQPGASGRDAALGRDARHLGVDEPGAALGPLGVVDEVPVGGAAVDRLVLRHRRHHDPVGQLHAAQAERREHRRAAGLASGLLLEPVLRRAQPLPDRAAAGSRARCAATG